MRCTPGSKIRPGSYTGSSGMPIGLLWHDQPMKRFDRYVGFVSPPASFDITPQQS